MRVDDIDISVVLPCFDEEGCIERFLFEVLGVMRGLGRSFEVICVDDGSTDASGAILDRLAASVPELTVLHHVRNAGLSAAFATGFRHARGQVVVTLDSDEQNDPSSIPDLLAALHGNDAVCGVRAVRRDDWLKRVSSRIGNGFRNVVTGDHVTDAACSFRAMRREALAELPAFNGMHRFLATILRCQGFRVAEVPVRHRPRTTGRSKYGVRNRLFRGVADCFAMRWLRRRLLPGRRVRITEPVGR